MSYGKLSIHRLERGLYTIKSGYFSKALTEVCKQVPGVRYEPQLGWYGYADAIQCVRDGLSSRGISLEGELPAPDSWKEGVLTLPVASKGVGDLELRPYQREGVKFLVARATEGCLLADGMRLGKSAQATVAARAFKEKTLIVCPPHVAGVWGRPPGSIKPGEIARWWPDAWRAQEGTQGLSVLVLEGVEPAKYQDAFRQLSQKKLDKLSSAQRKEYAEATAKLEERHEEIENALVIICHSAIVYAWVEVLLRWGPRTLILDEIHDYSHYSTKRSEAVKELALASIRRMGLSGTPMVNRPRDLHNPIDILCPNRFGVFFRQEGSSFARNFCGSFQKTVGTGPEAKTVWDHSGKSNEELLHKRISYFMFRRVKSEVDSQLPEKTRQIIDVKIPVGKTVMPTFDVLKDRAHLRRVLDLAADGKLAQVVALVKQHVEEGEKILVFCHRQRFAEAIADELRGFADCGVAVVHGGVTMRDRESRMRQAERASGPFVFSCTIESCSTGIDLSFASVAVFAELTWEPSELQQAEDRLYRVGSGGKSLVQYVIARGTGDELILRSVIAKLDDFEKIIGKTGDTLKKDLSPTRSREDAMAALGKALLAMGQEKNEKKGKNR